METKKLYFPPRTDSIPVRLEVNIMSETGNGSGQNLNKTELSGGFDDYFN